MTGGARDGRSVFLVDVDGVLINDPEIQSDLRRHLEQVCGTSCRARYFAILERLRKSLGYYDYLGALQRYRIEYPHDRGMHSVAFFLLDYPFRERLCPHALDVLRHLRHWGRAVVLSDGDAVFQPRKIQLSGIAEAVDGQMLVYIHKEDALDDIREQYPADHYVMLDHSLQILAAFRRAWGGLLSTVLVDGSESRTGEAPVPSYSTPDLTVNHIGELLNYDFSSLCAGGQVAALR